MLIRKDLSTKGGVFIETRIVINMMTMPVPDYRFKESCDNLYLAIDLVFKYTIILSLGNPYWSYSFTELIFKLIGKHGAYS